jgi:prepilin-type N-terminal cleavage/methylation domain-containing protein
MRHQHPTFRRGFTLVELMVSAALAVLIMTVLAMAFSAGLESLSHLKSLGGLAERLRTTHNLLDEDLKAQHFDGGGTGGAPALSDLRYDQLLTPGSTAAAPPAGGFLSLRQGTGSVYEGSDQDGVFATRGTDHVLGMTVRRVGKRPDQLFTLDLTPLITFANTPGNPAAQRTQAAQAVVTLNAASLNDVPTPTPVAVASPANLAVQIPVSPTFVADWAEVYWFLGNPQVIGGVTNHTLYRRVRVLTPQPVDFPQGTGLESTLSCFPVTPGGGQPPFWRTNTLDSIRTPTNRLYAAPNTAPSAIPATDPKHGDDIVLTNVISFDVKPLWTQQGPQWQTPGATTGAPPNIYEAPPAARTVLPSTITPATVGNVIPFAPFPIVPPGTVLNAEHPYDDLPAMNRPGFPSPHLPENTSPAYAAQRVFDTWAPLPNWNVPGHPTTIPFRARMLGVQIKVRAFEVKNKMTRQSTLIVKL